MSYAPILNLFVHKGAVGAHDMQQLTRGKIDKSLGRETSQQKVSNKGKRSWNRSYTGWNSFRGLRQKYKLMKVKYGMYLNYHT